MAKNEATLEERIGNVLSNAFPTFREVNIEHQRSFSFNFGNHNVTVDSKEAGGRPSRAIFDILLTIEGKNAILLELKREGVILTDQNVSQAISYARLTHPMPPLTLVSNGVTNEFYNTYTRQKIDRDTIDLAFIQQITDNAFQLAVNDFKEAVALLLNNDPEVFSQVINQISEKRFQRFTGEVGDVAKPIFPGLIIPRKAVAKIQQQVSEGAALVGIIGSAFSGKTNLLYQFFESNKSVDSFLLYIDCADNNYSILQLLANHFSANAKLSITKDKIREWLINSLNNLPEKKFFLLVDNFNDDIPDIIGEEIIELIDIFNGVNHHTIYTIDEFNFKQLAFVTNRKYRKIIGERSKVVALNELDSEEFEEMAKLLFHRFRLVIEHGGYYTPEYREPRVIRLLTSLFSDRLVDDQFVKIMAVPDYEVLRAIAKNNVYTVRIQELYKKIVTCFLQEAEVRRADEELGVLAAGSGAISVEGFKRNFPDDFDELVRSSTVVLRRLPNGTQVIYPKIHELVSVHGVSLITSKLADQAEAGETFTGICTAFLDMVTPFPYCDLVAAGVLLQLPYQGENHLFSNLVKLLLDIPPRTEKVEKGTKVVLYSEDVGHIRIDFEDDMDEGGFMTDFLPYAILSQLAGYPLKMEEVSEYSVYAFHLTLLYKLGSNKHFLRRADAQTLRNIKGHEGYEFKDIGYLVSGRSGIIEPIVQSIQKCFYKITGELSPLFDRAFEEENVMLLYRCYLALRGLVHSTDSLIAEKAQAFLQRFNPFFSKFMADFLSKSIPDTTERQEFYLKLVSIKETE